jgi:ABC-type transport system involved in cytochrome c biogenesis ATPase subunit
MKLSRLEVKNYRSLFHDYTSGKSFQMAVTDGVNAITGPNNAGKSNILRALALALDPDFEFDRRLDMPAVWDAWSKPVVTLTFQIPLAGAPSRERTLLKRLEDYEQQVKPGTKTYASMGEVRLRVAIEQGQDSKGVRRRTFVARGAGAKQLGYEDAVTLAALDQFDRCLQFVMIRSGESLASLLQGRFREVLETVLREELRSEFEAAEKSRRDYIQALQNGVLTSLRERISGELADLFPEITAVELEPNVRSLEDTLTSMSVRVSDVALTDLADKGTGVRGGLIIAMLQHLATSSRRSILFAVEEPESFLHPAAQEALRGDLESLAARQDASVLITTHSPYVISRQPDAQVIAIRKDDEGRTVVHDQKRGHEPMQPALSGLFRNSLLAGFLDRAARAGSDEKAVLVVEGETDEAWICWAAQLAGRSDLLEGLTIEVAGGATAAVAQALLLQATSENPVAVLFDNDDDGKHCLGLMKGFNEKTKVWGEGKRVFSYRMVLNPGDHQFGYEAEDLWPDHLHAGFLAKADEAECLAEKTKRPKPLGGFHYGYTTQAKGLFSNHVLQAAKPSDCDAWIRLLELIRGGLGI